MHRGILLNPAGISVRLIFDDSVTEDFVAAVKRSWGSMNPADFKAEPGVFADPENTIFLTSGEYTDYFEQPVTVLDIADTAQTQERLTVAVTLKMLKSLAGTTHLFHAAALADRESRSALVLIGPSGRGKTTASRFLGQQLTYLSDETAVVDTKLNIRPYPKPLSIIEQKGKPKIQYDPAELGMRVADPADFSYRLQHLVLLNRVDEQCQPTLYREPLADALIEIVQQTSGLARIEDGLLRLIELVQACGGALRMTYHEVADTLDLVQRLLAGSETVPAVCETVQYMREPDNTPVAEGKIQRVPGTAACLVGQRLLLFRDSKLFEVSPFAADCWLLLNQPLTVEELKTEVEQTYGQIPDEAFCGVLEQLRAGEVVL